MRYENDNILTNLTICCAMVNISYINKCSIEYYEKKLVNANSYEFLNGL